MGGTKLPYLTALTLLKILTCINSINYYNYKGNYLQLIERADCLFTTIRKSIYTVDIIWLIVLINPYHKNHYTWM